MSVITHNQHPHPQICLAFDYICVCGRDIAYRNVPKESENKIRNFLVKESFQIMIPKLETAQGKMVGYTICKLNRDIVKRHDNI